MSNLNIYAICMENHVNTKLRITSSFLMRFFTRGVSV